MTIDDTLHLTQFPPRGTLVKETRLKFLNDMKVPILDLKSIDELAPPLPPVFSIRSSMSPAKDQGTASLCTAFGVISCLDFFHNREDLSEAQLVHVSETNFGDCVAGLGLDTAMVAARDTGVVLETNWPYDEAQVCWLSPPDVTQLIHYRFTEVQAIFSRQVGLVAEDIRKQLRYGLNKADLAPPVSPLVTAIRAALARSSTPVAVSVPVWFNTDSTMEAGWEAGPHIQMPSPVHLETWLQANAALPAPVSGWHVIAVCGYDERIARFEFKNSWSQFWGDEGFGTIPYDYIARYASTAMRGWV